MRFRKVRLPAVAVELPPEVVTSAEIEARLAPLYDRLRLPAGRLELMTGIRERRFWEAGTKPSDAASRAGRKVLDAWPRLPPSSIGLLAHTAVCRDMLEPATASFVHRRLQLSGNCQVLDLSNACLGFLNGMVLAAGLIESGQLPAALLVTGEDGKPLVDHTIGELLKRPHSRKEIKPYFANLTIGSAGAAALLCHEDLAPHAPRLLGGVVRAASQYNDLCLGDTAGSGEGLSMLTDSEELLKAGVETAQATWREFLAHLEWTPGSIARCINHQVGSAHQRLLFSTLGIPLEKDFPTYPFLGNTGSAALPATLALAAATARFQTGDRIALLGIGSGINCMMLGLEWDAS